MSTRSIIAATTDGVTRSIYCHSDGYLEGVGATLLRSYTDGAKIDALLALGDISVLGDRVVPNDDEADHCFERRAKGVTVAYGRDRGEEGTEAETHDPGMFMRNPRTEQYTYLHDGEKWLVRCRTGWRPVSEALASDKNDA